MVPGLRERQSELGSEPFDGPTGKTGRGVQARTHGGAAKRQLADPGEAGGEALDAVLDGGCITAKLLAEGDRGGVHEVGAARLHHRGKLRGFLP